MSKKKQPGAPSTRQPHGGQASFGLVHLLKGQTSEIGRFAWTPDGQTIVLPARDGSVSIWNVTSGKLMKRLKACEPGVTSVAISPNGSLAAFGSYDKFLRIYDLSTLKWRPTLREDAPSVRLSVAWGSDSRTLMTGSEDGEIQIWDTERRIPSVSLAPHSGAVNAIAWSPDGRLCASGSSDKSIKIWDSSSWTVLQSIGCSEAVLKLEWFPGGKLLAVATAEDVVHIWDIETGRLASVLEGHTDTANDVSFSSDGRFLVTRSLDNSIRVWRCDTWETIDIISAISSDFLFSGVAFHPTLSRIAVLTERDRALSVFEFSPDILLRSAPATNSVHYVNAKVVLVGDSGVGKTGLGLVLTGHEYVATSSTHARYVWTFDSRSVELTGGRRETRETLLWDLAGQPGYRLIHQLHLNEVAVALLLFDANNDVDPFAGVRHWDRALSKASHAQGSVVARMKKFLVEARIDRGKVPVSRARIDDFVQDRGFAGFFETSAKDGLGVQALEAAIRSSIDWDALPKVRSTELFSKIKSFLVNEKLAGHILSTTKDLFRSFVHSSEPPTPSDLQAQFETCTGHVESRGLIRRLSFGSLVLLQPEFFDAYASAIVNAAKEEPDGLGSVVESDVRAGLFRLSKDERIQDQEQEKLLLIATIEDLLRHEIALRESAEDGMLLVFPSQLTREKPDLPDPEGKAVAFTFEGPVANIYATLAVRLSHSGVFHRKEMWKNAALYSTKSGGVCGISVREDGEGTGDLILFFDELVSEEIRFQFEDYVEAHLKRRAIFESIRRKLIISCNECQTLFTDQQIEKRRARGFDWIGCNVCDERVPLDDGRARRGERFAGPRISNVREIDRAADVHRERDAGIYVLEGKMATNDFDVFLCHNSKDKAEVKNLGEVLKKRAILPWLDEWELRPGLPWQQVLEDQIEKIKTAAVFVGKEGIGPWQNQEQAAFLRQFAQRGCPVIPVVLSSCGVVLPKLPVFLGGMTWIDLRKSDPDPIKQLIWGITGRRR